MIADPATSPQVRESLMLATEAREYARSLGLDVSDQYTRYAEWEGDRVVTTVVATEAGSISPAGFDFPIVGRLPYKGFFDPGLAEEEAARLEARGLDTCLLAVPAYSTLGWFADPLTTPMLRGGPVRLVETVIHELVHATVFATDAADFNEGLATFVGEQGMLRFFESRGSSPEPLARVRRRLADDRRVESAMLAFRTEVAALYAESPPGEEQRRRRAALERGTRERLAALPLETRDPAALSTRLRLNDACLSISSTYTADLGRYADVLETLDGDLGALIAAAREAAATDDPRTHLLGPGRAAARE